MDYVVFSLSDIEQLFRAIVISLGSGNGSGRGTDFQVSDGQKYYSKHGTAPQNPSDCRLQGLP